MAGSNDGTVLPGCYYPECDRDHAPGRKFCPAHGGPPVPSGPSDPEQEPEEQEQQAP